VKLRINHYWMAFALLLTVISSFQVMSLDSPSHPSRMKNQNSGTAKKTAAHSEVDGQSASSEASDPNQAGSRPCGPPDYGCSYDGLEPKPLCTDCALPSVPDMSAEPNAVYFDKTFGKGTGNEIVRCTYPDTNDHNNHVYVIGSGGSGDSHGIGKAGGSPPSYRLVIGDTHGAAYPFTFVPDPVHPQCHPTYNPMSSFVVGDGSFSWVIPHLYFEFVNLKVKTLDLGSSRPPRPVPVVDFRQILPHDGPDWPGPGQLVTLGTIIKPRTNNPGKYLYQATCPPMHPDCTIGTTAATVPQFSQDVMTNTVDAGMRWRNIGPGFAGGATWSTIGGVSTDDDVFVEGFSDAGGQGGPGAIFVAAYKRSKNTYFLYNVGTGVVSYFQCIGGSGFACSQGSWHETILGLSTVPDRFLLHNVKVNKSGEWIVIVLEECRFRTCSIMPGSFGPYFWKLSSSEAKVTKLFNHPYGHWTEGFHLFANQNGDPGVNLNGRTFERPEEQFPLNETAHTSESTEGIDAHPSWNYNDGSDTTPVCTATAGLDWPYTIPWENEVVCFGTNPEPDCSKSGHQLCRNIAKRFFHTYNPATCDQNDGFWGCWGIGTLSQDGRYYAFTSNWGNTLGSTLQGGHGPGSCRGGFNFQINHDYKVDDVFEPSNGGHGRANSSFNVYRVTAAGRSDSYPPDPWPTGWRLKRNRFQGFYQAGETILPHINNACNHAFRVAGGSGAPNGEAPPHWEKLYGYNGSCSNTSTGAEVDDGGITWKDIGEYTLGTMHIANTGRDDCRSDVFVGALK